MLEGGFCRGWGGKGVLSEWGRWSLYVEEG